MCSASGIVLPFSDTRDLTDEEESKALQHRHTVVDIYSNSWGRPETSYILGDVGTLATNAIKDGITNVRIGTT